MHYLDRIFCDNPVQPSGSNSLVNFNSLTGTYQQTCKKGTSFFNGKDVMDLTCQPGNVWNYGTCSERNSFL